jgi:hypothetical protein
MGTVLDEKGAEILVTQKKAKYLQFDAAKFIVDSIGNGLITGHFVLIKMGGDSLVLPRITLEVGYGALLDGVKIKTRITSKY